jgi:hypothetical protein
MKHTICGSRVYLTLLPIKSLSCSAGPLVHPSGYLRQRREVVVVAHERCSRLLLLVLARDLLAVAVILGRLVGRAFMIQTIAYKYVGGTISNEMANLLKEVAIDHPDLDAALNAKVTEPQKIRERRERHAAKKAARGA